MLAIDLTGSSVDGFSKISSLWVGTGSCYQPKVRGFTLTVMVLPFKLRRRNRVPTSSARANNIVSTSAAVSASWGRVMELPMDLPCRVGINRAVVLALGQLGQVRSIGTEALLKTASGKPAKSPIVNTPRLFRAAVVCGPTPNSLSTASGQIRLAMLSAVMITNPSGFSRSDAILAKILLGGNTDRAGQIQLVFDFLFDFPSNVVRWAEQILAATNVQPGFVDGILLYQGRKRIKMAMICLE